MYIVHSGMGLSITLKTGVKLPGWLWGAIAQWSEYSTDHKQLNARSRLTREGGARLNYPGLPSGALGCSRMSQD